MKRTWIKLWENFKRPNICLIGESKEQKTLWEQKKNGKNNGQCVSKSDEK